MSPVYDQAACARNLDSRVNLAIPLIDGVGIDGRELSGASRKNAENQKEHKPNGCHPRGR